jgi:hypothetical protein
MIRMTLIAGATLAAIASVSPAAAQASAPVRTLAPAHTVVASTVLIAERKVALCADKSCAGRPLKRNYVAAAPLGW